ncbi:MAG: hypothetical protein EOM30_06070 [Clostridia bacterium]|nr:hypothetical protein [Clostridia bacterium]NLS84132.1 hypothetical protein [Oscillospiraceae bacterium]
MPLVSCVPSMKMPSLAPESAFAPTAGSENTTPSNIRKTDSIIQSVAKAALATAKMYPVFTFVLLMP